MKKVFILSFLLFFATFAKALSLDELSSSLKTQVNLRSDFIQERTISGFSKPLISKGELLVSKDKGVLWMQKEPLSVIYVITDKKINTVVNNNTVNSLKASDNPQMFYFSSLLKSILNADKDVLYENFTVNLSGKRDAWVLVLEPKVTPLNKIFKKFELNGSKFINSITLYDKENDVTKIIFSKHQDTNIKLTDYETELFNL